MERNPAQNSSWNQTRSEIAAFTDRLGHPVEAGVLDALTGMNLLGLPTDSSCEGHLEGERFRAPYIQGKAKDRPFYRFVGQRESTQNFLAKHSLQSVGDIFLDDTLMEQYDDLLLEFREETEEYKIWSMENSQLKESVRRLVHDYISHEHISGRSPEIKLDSAYPAYRIEFGNQETHDAEEALQDAQTELSRFSDYLKTLVLGL